jgi:hypothetical protein
LRFKTCPPVAQSSPAAIDTNYSPGRSAALSSAELRYASEQISPLDHRRVAILLGESSPVVGDLGEPLLLGKQLLTTGQILRLPQSSARPGTYRICGERQVIAQTP